MSSSVEEGRCIAVCQDVIESWRSFSKAKRAFLSVVTLALLVFVFATLNPRLRSWMHNRETKVPEEIVGMWMTDASSYEGRYLRINGHYLATKFDVTELPSVQEVDKIKIEQFGRIRDYTLFYTDETGARGQITIEVDSGAKDQMRLGKAKQIVWRRQPTN
jgi:hypothetical protein